MKNRNLIVIITAIIIIVVISGALIYTNYNPATTPTGNIYYVAKNGNNRI